MIFDGTEALFVYPAISIVKACASVEVGTQLPPVNWVGHPDLDSFGGHAADGARMWM